MRHPCRTLWVAILICFMRKSKYEENVILNVQNICWTWVGYKALKHTVHAIFFSYIFLCGPHHTQEWRLYSIIVLIEWICSCMAVVLYRSILMHLIFWYHHWNWVWTELCRRKQCWISGSTTNVNHRTKYFSADIATHQANTH